MIIGITGNIGSGKDTVAKMIQYYYYCKSKTRNYATLDLNEWIKNDILRETEEIESGWQIKKFAYKLKQIAAILVGCKPEDFESEEFKNSYLPMPLWKHKDGNFSLSYRQLLQKLGTEAIRNNIGENTWINALFSEYHCNEYDGETECTDDLCNMPNWIISDVRFLNEEKAIRDRNGKIIKVERNLSYISNHKSETELSEIKPDFTLYNYTTIESLYNGVCDCLKHFGY